MYYIDGSLFGVQSILAYLANEVCDDKIFGDGEVRVLIWEIQYNDGSEVMSIKKCPLTQTKLSTNILISNILEFCSANEFSDSGDEEEGVRIALYNVVWQVLKAQKKTPKYILQTSLEAVKLISS